MVDAATVMQRLDACSLELDRLSKDLADVDRKLEPVEIAYEKFLDDFEVGLQTRSEEDESYKLPSEAMRLRLARRAMEADVLGRYAALLHSRKRLERRLSSLRAFVSAQQSILSALKVELESTH